MGEKLKPCPFCGGVAYIEQTGNRRQSTIYECESCGCRLETGEEFSHGKRWNERSESDEITRLRAEVAALAEQNKIVRDALEGVADSDEECEDSDGWLAAVISMAALHQAQEAIELPDLASPVLNRVKAEALRDAADEFDAQGEWKGHGQQLRKMADDIEKGEALAAIKEIEYD